MFNLGILTCSDMGSTGDRNDTHGDAYRNHAEIAEFWNIFLDKKLHPTDLKLGIIKDIIDADPTDGLWDDNRNDENQLGLSYKQIEEAMINKNSEHYKKYYKIREPNLHKMKPIPVCVFPKK